MKRIYVDTEYMWGDLFFEKRLPKDSDKKQIIQIGAVLFDHYIGKELGTLNVLVKPVFHKTVPKFFVELTGITEKSIKKKAISFSEASKSFLNFCEGFPIWTFNNDFAVFKQNYLFHGIQFPFKKDFVRVKSKLHSWGIDPDVYSSGTLYKAANLDLQGSVHNALHDARSMARAVHFFENKSNN